MTGTTLKDRLLNTSLLAGVAAAITFSLPAAALAQQDPEVEADEPTVEADDEDMGDERMIVTGSRIARSNLDTVRPSIVADQQLIRDRAFTNIADLLNEVPAFGAGIDPNGAQNAFTVGQNFVDLFDLGTQRTLTLVNGRRFVSSNVPTIFGTAGGLQVDLNTIPAALVDRIETVPLAGAAVYGSDAIAGTVNVILRDDYEGFEVSGQYGLTEEGDADNYQVQAVFGSNFDDGRGNVTFSVEFNKQEGLVRLDRPNIYGNNPDFLNFGALDRDGDGELDDVDGDGFPDSFQRPVFGGQRVQLLSFGGAVSVPPDFFAPSIGAGALPDGNFYQFNPEGELETCTPGETPAGSIFFSYGGTCGVDFFDSVTQIRSPLTRLVVSGNGRYDLTDNVRFVTEFIFANSQSSELLNQGGFQSFPFAGESGPIAVSVDNPFLTDQARGILQANGLTNFNVNRFNNDLVGSGADNTENFTWRVAAALEGDFEAVGRRFNWDLNAVFGQADVETQGFGIVDGRFFNAVDAVELTQELLDENGVTLDDVIGVAGIGQIELGQTICRVHVDNAAGNLTGFNEPAQGGGLVDSNLPFATGCQPLNLFGEGNQSPEALQFINGGPQITSSDIDQIVLTANFGGDLIELPAGWVRFSAGFENRRERAEFTPGLGTAVPITRSAPFDPVSGRLTTEEFYGEVNIPLLSEDMGIWGVNFLEFEGSARRVKNTVTDPNDVQTENTATVYEYGGRFSPYEGIIFRGSFTSAIRTPSLVELFSPQVQAFISGDDPCDNRLVNDGPFPEVRRANCIAEGIDPDNFTSNVVNATIIGSTGGNPDLVPERARSWTVGGVFTPIWVPGLAITVDYFQIDIEDRIENFDLDALFETCYDSTAFPNVDACNAFVRDPETFQVIDATESFLNAASSNFKGINMALQYTFDIAEAIELTPWEMTNRWAQRDLGELEWRFNVFHNITRTTDIVPTRPGDEDVGDFIDPSWSGTFDTIYTRGNFRFFYRVIYQDSPLFDSTGNDIFLDENDNIITDTDARLLHNISLQYTLFESTQIQLAVDNLFDREPDTFETADFHFGIAEELGRRYTFRVRTAF
ncbi:MAG: TonB-dependent receptor domain-containing protein [Alphaproteobacteria bacterium]